MVSAMENEPLASFMYQSLCYDALYKKVERKVGHQMIDYFKRKLNCLSKNEKEVSPAYIFHGLRVLFAFFSAQDLQRSWVKQG